MAMAFYTALGMLGVWVFSRLFRLGREVAFSRRARGSSDPMVRLHLADVMAQERRHDEALAEYLWCFDHGLEGHSEFTGVRLSFLLSSLARLGAVHPPAREAMLQRRDRLELAIAGGTAQLEEGADYAALNHSLGDDPRTLATSQRLTEDGKAAQKLRSLLFRSVFDALLEARRYQDILNSCGPVDVHIDQSIEGFEVTKAMVEGRIEIPAPPGMDVVQTRLAFAAGKPKLLEIGREEVLETGGKFFETLLGASRGDEARRLADRLIDFHPAGRTYAALVRHALRAARPDVSAELARRGKETLPRDQRAEIDAASRPPRLP